MKTPAKLWIAEATLSKPISPDWLFFSPAQLLTDGLGLDEEYGAGLQGISGVWQQPDSSSLRVIQFKLGDKRLPSGAVAEEFSRQYRSFVKRSKGTFPTKEEVARLKEDARTIIYNRTPLTISHVPVMVMRSATASVKWYVVVADCSAECAVALRNRLLWPEDVEVDWVLYNGSAAMDCISANDVGSLTSFEDAAASLPVATWVFGGQCSWRSSSSGATLRTTAGAIRLSAAKEALGDAECSTISLMDYAEVLPCVVRIDASGSLRAQDWATVTPFKFEAEKPDTSQQTDQDPTRVDVIDAWSDGGALVIWEEQLRYLCRYAMSLRHVRPQQ